MKPIRYTVLTENQLSLLIQDVNFHIKNNWVPLGNISTLPRTGGVHQFIYFQAMVQYEEFNEFKPA